MNNKQWLLDLEIKNLNRDLKEINKDVECYTDYTWNSLIEFLLNIGRFTIGTWYLIKYWIQKIKVLIKLRKKNNEL